MVITIVHIQFLKPEVCLLLEGSEPLGFVKMHRTAFFHYLSYESTARCLLSHLRWKDTLQALRQKRKSSRFHKALASRD